MTFTGWHHKLTFLFQFYFRMNYFYTRCVFYSINGKMWWIKLRHTNTKPHCEIKTNNNWSSLSSTLMKTAENSIATSRNVEVATTESNWIIFFFTSMRQIHVLKTKRNKNKRVKLTHRELAKRTFVLFFWSTVGCCCCCSFSICVKHVYVVALCPNEREDVFVAATTAK